MKKNTILGFNLVWGVLLLLVFSWFALGSYHYIKIIFLLLSALFVTSAIFALKGKRWATIISAIFALLFFIRWAPMVAVNFYMCFTGHELYKDSPATIFIVWIYFILFVLPSAFMLWHYITKRKLFFKSSQKSEQAEQSPWEG